MHRYMCSHDSGSERFTREQICELAEKAQHSPEVRGYRSFFNLTEGKAFCILEAESPEAVAAWFDELKLPYNDITLVELEGERGVIQEVLAVAAV